MKRIVRRYKRVNQNPYIEEEQTTQWPKEKVQKDKQPSTKHTYKTKDRVTRTPLKTGGELRCSGRVSSSCSTSDTRRVNLVTNPVISHERGKDQEVLTTSGPYPWSFVTQIFCNIWFSLTTFFVLPNDHNLSHLQLIWIFEKHYCKILYQKNIQTDLIVKEIQRGYIFFNT